MERGLSGYGGNSRIVPVFIREYQPDPHNPCSIVSLSDKLLVRDGANRAMAQTKTCRRPISRYQRDKSRVPDRSRAYRNRPTFI